MPINEEEHIQSEDTEQDFDINYYRQKYALSDAECNKLESFRVTREQRLEIMGYPQRSEEWLQARSGRLTASNFGAAIGHNRYKTARATIASMLWRTFRGNAATRWGQEHEDIAARLYESYMIQLRGPEHRFETAFPNLIVSLKYPWAGVSPDGFVRDGDRLGGLEIKCPFRKRLYDFIPAMYYDQIQGTMGFLGLKFWDFVVWTPNFMQIRRVPFDEAYWSQELLPGLEKFYMTQVLPRLVMKDQGLLEEPAIDPAIYVELPEDVFRLTQPPKEEQEPDLTIERMPEDFGQCGFNFG